MADKTEQDVYEEDPLALARAYGVEPVDPDETLESAKTVGQFALESLPGVGTAFTVADIEDELKKEDPNYIKIGMLVGTEAIGLIPGLGTAAKNMIRKGADMARQTDEAMDVASNIPKVSRTSNSDKEKALAMIESQELRNAWVSNKRKELGISDTDKDYSSRDLVSKQEVKRRQTRKFPEQIKDLEEDRMSGPEYRRYIRENQPATKFTKEDVEGMLTSFEDMVGGLDALGQNKASKGIIGLTDDVEVGAEVAARLDIPAYNKRDIWVAQITGAGKNMYGRTAVLKDVKFFIEGKDPARKSKKMRDVGKGEKDKSPFATMKGEWQGLSDEEAFNRALSLMDDPEWIQVGFNPERHSFFYDKDTMMPVFEAEEVIQVGPLVLAKKAKLGNKRIDPETGKESSYVPAERIKKIRELKIEDKPGKPTVFNQGGVAMNEQMEMAFMREGGVPDNTIGVDPVSGNDIPVGSTAEEVRDDVPAMLSEGEYVVPADVVKYHGLALFEALRNQAKFGLREMAEDGRIGGEPIEDDMEEDLTAEDEQLLQEIMTMEEDEGVVKAAYGTFIPGNTSTTVPSSQVQMPTSGQTPASTQQVQPATTQQDPSGVYGIVTGTGQPVTSSTPLVNQQPVVQGVVGTAPVTGDSTTTPGTTQTGMVTKKYVAPDCRRIDVLTLNGKIISSTPADFDTFVEATEANLKRFNCVTSDDDKTDDTTDTTTTLTGGGDDDDNGPDIKTTSDPKFDTTTDKGSRDAADYFKEKSGVSVVDPFKAAQDALNNALNADTMKGAGALAGLILGPVGTLGAGVINAGSQIDALSTAYANKSMADYLGKTGVSNSIQKAIDEFLGKAPGIVKFANKSSDLGKKKMEYALLSAQSVNAPDDMALTEDRFGSSEAFNSAMNEVATSGMVYNPEEKVYERTTETVQVPTTGGGSVTVGAGTQASTASAATVDKDTGRVVFTPGEKTVRPVLRPPNLTSGSGGDDSSSAPVGVVGNNDTGSNDLAQSVANFFTPNDGKEYQNGVLVSTSSNDDNNDSPSSSESSDCCFIMLEARYGNGTMDEVVRRYRDEYMTARNRRGYYKTAEVLVPLMRKSKVFKWVVTKTFADPLVSYGKYYYGENKHGVIFTPVKNFWMKLFDVVGGDTEFIRENGEVV